MFHDDKEHLKQELHELKLEHRALDEKIHHMTEVVYVDQLKLRRLKKRKLMLKDQIEKIHSNLIPDIDA